MTDPGVLLAAPWPVGLAAALLAGLLLWPVGARLGLAPAARAAAAALYSGAALLVEAYAPTGVDGRGTLLLVVAAGLAVGGVARNTGAALVTAAAVAVSPITAVGFLVLLGGMAWTGGLASRWPTAVRRTLAVGAFAVAAAVPVALVRPEEPTALPPIVLGVLSLWALVVTTLLWRRLGWLRPAGAAVLALLGCSWVPGPDADAVVVVAAAVAVLTAVLAEEFPTVLVRRLAAVAVATVAVTAALLVPGAAEFAPAAPALVPSPAALRIGPPAGQEGPRALVRPLTISIPALGVRGPLEDLTADPDTGELSAPDDPSQVGWFAAGVVPGDAGPAVVGGHVDSRAGPGVFFGLRELLAGSRVEITRSDGRTVSFTVTAVTRYPKDHFPTAAVYGPAPGPELRLVTCGGAFDRSARSYEDNIVVDAVLV